MPCKRDYTTLKARERELLAKLRGDRKRLLALKLEVGTWPKLAEHLGLDNHNQIYNFVWHNKPIKNPDIAKKAGVVNSKLRYSRWLRKRLNEIAEELMPGKSMNQILRMAAKAEVELNIIKKDKKNNNE